MTGRKRWFFFLAVVLAVLVSIVVGGNAFADSQAFLSELSAAKGDLSLGEALKVHIGAKAQETWEDNIFNAADNEEEDFITTVTPGLLFSLGEKYKFEAGYAVDIHTYADFDDEDYTSQAAKASLDLNFTGGLGLGLSDVYIDTEDVRPEIGQDRISHIVNNARAEASYLFPGKKLKVGVDYSQMYLKYDQEENETANRRDDSPGATVSYKFLPKTAVFLEYHYTATDYFDSADESTDADSETHAAGVGLSWDPTAKLAGKLSTGWESRGYDNEQDPDGNEYDDKDLWAAYADLAWKATSKTTVALRLVRAFEETVYGGDISASPGGNVPVDVSEASHYENTGGSISVAQKLDPKVTLRAGASYNKHEYNNLDSALDAREDDLVGFDIGVEYAFRDWLSSGLGYSFAEADSNDESRDERHNRVSLNVTLAI